MQYSVCHQINVEASWFCGCG